MSLKIDGHFGHSQEHVPMLSQSFAVRRQIQCLLCPTGTGPVLLGLHLPGVPIRSIKSRSMLLVPVDLCALLAYSGGEILEET